MNNKIILLLVSLFCLGSVATPSDASSLDFDLSCPAAVKVGAPLNVVVRNIKNWDDGNSVVLKRYICGIVANTSDTVGNAGFYGPFNRSYTTAKTVPPATTSPSYSPGTIPDFSAPVVIATPDVSGKVALIFVQFLTSDGQEMESGNCMVNIIP